MFDVQRPGNSLKLYECPTPIFHGDFPFVSLFFFYKNILYAWFYRFMPDIIYIGIEI